MAASYALNAGDPLDDLVSRVRGGHQPILLSRSGEPVAAVVTIGEFREYERWRDEADLAPARSVFEDPDTGWISHEEAMVILDADEQKEAAG
ncbi:type II toxin-antitoxin system prevent-host-death family antitoxin [Actinacidiphila oryziradicis]|jgi:prevent-host-death family protein|uniref:type II toxin-antitoxin system prevent-host-death family antitoxin n=1 Tax=Actinacidiphila oryziradicis TaxID=2571141 RepID=UPI0023F3C4D9|nr:type II toxin-antitoxin system prevent-host-death family antitoxin [Actinacidiphila oryziradicis]MCW2874807.1 type toxin-antitoxin system Phd/YefM family antitoxin [Actinacidiphila oryziradicis]